VKPAPFAYVAPRSLEEALEALAERGDEAKILAGGQSLIPVLNFRLAQPTALVDLNRVPGLDGISKEAGALRIGALARQRTLERDATIAAHAPLLAEAIPHVAHPQIRNRGTLGGSLAHADPAAELPAVALALDARFRIARRGGERWVEAHDFFTGLFSTVLAADEILIEVELPAPPPRTGWAFLESARRHGDYALAGVAARVTLDGDGRCASSRLVLLSVGDGPVDARRAAEALAGSGLEADAVAAACELASGEEIDPIGDVHASAAFKRQLVRVLTRRALDAAARRAREAA